MKATEKTIIIDTETTGLSTTEDEVLTLSIIDGNGHILFDRMFKPERHDEWPKAQSVNHISPEMCEGKMPISAYKEEIESIVNGADVVAGYNHEGYDLPILRSAGLDLHPKRTYDLMLEYSAFIGEKRNDGAVRWQSLAKCCARYSVVNRMPHASLGDCYATLECMQKYADELACGKPRLMVDLDGVCAVFQDVPIKELLKEGYYATLPPIEGVVAAVEEVARSGKVDVYILSAYLRNSKYAKSEKMSWVAKHLPSVSAGNVILIPSGSRKADHVPGGVDGRTYLLDDFSKNLISWEEAGGKPIKMLNGINGTKGTFQGRKVSAASATLASDILEAMAV